ncbi:heterokaryon incompatibility, partial [Acephala macrosclerotiorum]
VSVTRNLEAALRDLRRQGCQDIWVDALCINQHDNQEKGYQILRMRDLYQKAENTVAWLGVDRE